ncbi:helix-turn-helix transcriptional regulator [Streptomyces sp. CA-294286]|uniref:helix-turn-helix transcriptional regulator n=1 Tax=Streptomyces sp. CA-294286 TaxID=3240070 RepID=UPI003D94F46B
MRAARLIKMVLLLQSRPTMTAAELARELEVSERTVQRDAQALSEAGVPVCSNRGRDGGYRLVGGYRTRLTGLARSEAEALFLSGLPGALREMGLEDAASAARLKVSAALLPSLRDASTNAAQRFHLDAPGWYQEPHTPELLPALAEAVWGDRVVRARYRRNDREVERRLDPYGLVLKGGIWYVCARVAGPGDVRVYRLERFTAAVVTDEPFVRDADFDLPGFWASRAADFARSLLRDEVRLRLSAAGAAALPRVTDAMASREALAAAEPPDAAGWVRVTLRVESVEVAYTQLLGLGAEVEVLGPEELRGRMAETGRRLAGLYGGAGGL